MKNRTIAIFMAVFIAGFLLGAGTLGALGGIAKRDHAREELKMAFYNRVIAIERRDRAMQTYFEEVIVWNAFRYPDPDFFSGNIYRIDWLNEPVEEPPYRRLKDGITYAELRGLLLKDSGKVPAAALMPAK